MDQHNTTTPRHGALSTSQMRHAMWMIGAAALFGLLAFASIELTREEGRIASVWLPNALAVAILLRQRLGWRREGATLALLWFANTLANVAGGDVLMHAGALSACNSLEIVIALQLVRRFCGLSPDMQDIDHLVRFVFLAGICAPLVSATAAMMVLSLEQAVSWNNWLQWALTDAMGMIIAAPSAMVVADAIKAPRWPNRREAASWLVLTVCGTAVIIAVFKQTDYPLLFLIAPVVVSYAFRLGSLGTAFSLAKLAALATVLTWSGSGPINLVDGTMGVKLIVLQAFLAATFVISMPVAAILCGRRKILLDLAEREMQLSLLADNITDAVLRYDLTGRCTYVSQSVQSVLGMEAEAFLGNQASQRTHPEAKELIAGAERRLLGGQSEKERITYRRYLDDANGKAVYIEADSAVARDSETGAPNGIIVSARDVTSRVKLERKLIRARKHAEDAALAKSQFLANMSHEIRTPMNGVLGFTELLLKSGLDREQHRHAELIDESGKSMMRLLNDILDISKIEAGQIRITQETIVLSHVLKSCVRLHSANAAQKGLRVALELDDTLPEAILSDSLRLRQIVLNLLGNAVKFTEAGIVTLRARCLDGCIEIAVADTGIGIPSERINGIFQPFEQADNATSRRYGGTGLGLAISRQLAELLGGTLAANSVVGVGSVFALQIPLLVPDKWSSAAALAEERAQDSPVLPPCRILLAEDHDINRILFTTMLEKCGQQVDTAEDGLLAIAAVETARTEGRPYHLVLMDVQLPHCDGYSATRRLRESGIGADELPIVALTANAYPEDIAAALEAGMQAHLAKPLEFDRLVSTLAEWLPDSGALSEPVLPAAPSTKTPAADSLQRKWEERRSEALMAVSAALRNGTMTGTDAAELAALVHKLAGTAGMFGEAELGTRALQFERALKDDCAAGTREELAHMLLETAKAG